MSPGCVPHATKCNVSTADAAASNRDAFESLVGLESVEERRPIVDAEEIAVEVEGGAGAAHRRFDAAQRRDIGEITKVFVLRRKVDNGPL